MKNLSKVERIKFCGVPIDILNEVDIKDTIIELLENNEVNQIVFLSLKDFIKARRKKNNDIKMLENASLVIPTSKVLIKGIKNCGLPEAYRHMPYYFILKLLRILDEKRKSIYVLGSTIQGINKVAENIRASYPTLKVVGRYKGNLNDFEEKNVLTAIKKSSPSISLIGTYIKDGNKWIYKNRNNFNSGIFIWNPQAMRVMSGIENSPSEKKWDKKDETVPLFRYLKFVVIKNKFKKEINNEKTTKI